MAAWGGHTEVAKMLLAQPGINTSVRNKDGKTAADLAKSDETASLIIQSMGTAGLVEDESDED
ncbi:hypothetical protein HK104_002686 [Borealophlyctis nickersoniae]|nr:hypothetical protein HK104_002686 [Borealophlyctis nickersoniae]